QRPVGPLVAVGRDLAVHVEIVEQHPATGDRVRVGGDAVVEDRQARIAVPAGDVAEHLVVGPVLPDDVDHVLELGRTVGGSDRGTEARVRKRTQRVHLTGVAPEPGRVGDRDDGYRTGNDVADVGSIRVRAGAVAFSVRDVEGAAVRGGGDGAGIPPGGDEAGGAQRL